MKNEKTMRITGGLLVRRRFMIPELVDEGVVRPTPDRVRESLFSMIREYLVDARVLDIFAGSGAHGFESVSRGAREVVLVEKNTSIAKTIKLNIEKLNLNEQCQLVITDALAFIKQPSIKGFDVIFVDPPYSLSLSNDFFMDLAKHLNENGLLIYRSFKKAALPFGQEWQILKDRSYGGTRVLVLMRPL